MKTLIIMPTYNEKENLELILEAIHEEVPDVHLLIVDDGSPDGTGDIADGLAEKDERIHVLHRTGKLGLGSAYITGFKWALERDYDLVFEMDADFSHNPKYLPIMIDALHTHDMVVGSRYIEGGGTENWGVGRKIISKGGGTYARTVLGMKVRDLTAGFVAYRRETLEAIDLDAVSAAGYGFQIELKYRVHCAGLSIKEIPIVFPDRVRGESKMSGNIFFEALVLVWKLRFKVKRGQTAAQGA
ncbi:MAG: polyprenol monophosphomannose synthase [Myxococcales bacterium]|nr:polyprenol monophosphomannose synthase [Myxococcales bacterium]